MKVLRQNVQRDRMSKNLWKDLENSIGEDYEVVVKELKMLDFRSELDLGEYAKDVNGGIPQDIEAKYKIVRSLQNTHGMTNSMSKVTFRAYTYTRQQQRGLHWALEV
ncbi:hypothetical protein QAD02_018637 [Eretmocerus hayati]|uniref:Uncharacterized protein n=1 Tax=Eretmocerus hayati TaxID=131215 RepID=A0ACC2PM39_9HYME|nr:hypothetical protein QAD02_018637 [Eretmocerus hayati]